MAKASRVAARQASALEEVAGKLDEVLGQLKRLTKRVEMLEATVAGLLPEEVGESSKGAEAKAEAS